MEKNKLNRFISKYSLSGKANSVIWEVKNNKLKTFILALLSQNWIQ